jgi:hypothetical protein
MAIGRNLYRELRDTGFFRSDDDRDAVALAAEAPGPDDPAPG